MGLDQIDELSFLSTGYGLPPQDPSQALYFDLLELVDAPVGQALSDVDFFTKHLNLSYSGLSAVKSAVLANSSFLSLHSLSP